MSFFDLFRKKLAQSVKPVASDKMATGTAKQPKSNISSFVKVTSEIIPSVTDEVIPAEKRIKDAIASKHLMKKAMYHTYTDTKSRIWIYRRLTK